MQQRKRAVLKKEINLQCFWLQMTSSPPDGGSTANDLLGYILDVNDEDCPDFSLHLAAYQGDVDQLRRLLEGRVPHADDQEDYINARIRPFMSTPLRLAATGTWSGSIFGNVISGAFL